MRKKLPQSNPIKFTNILKGLAITGVAVFALLFGTSILTNIHLGYLRFLSTWTVKLVNFAGNSGATGFVATADSGRKVIITNGHVCNLAQDGALVAIYRGDSYIVKVLKQYQMNDLCALEAPTTSTLPVRIAGSFTNGERGYAIGHPLLEPRSVTDGELSGPVLVSIVVGVNPNPNDCAGDTYELIDTSGTPYSFFGVNSLCVRSLESESSTIPILPGNSGSAIVNIFGSVIGVAFAANESGVRSYVVPLSDLKTFLGEL